MEPTQTPSPAAENATAETTNFSPAEAATTETSATPEASAPSGTEATSPDAAGSLPGAAPDALPAPDGADTAQPSTPDDAPSNAEVDESESVGHPEPASSNAAQNTASSAGADGDDGASAPVQEPGESSGGGENEREGADSVYIADVHTWWESTAIPGKEFAELRADGSLHLRGTATVSERHLGNLRADTKEATVKALTDKHTEVAARVEELRREWDSAEDKSKLEGRVSRLREYLQHAVSLGDYEPLFAAVSGWEAELSSTREARAQTKSQLVEEA